jgi:hypothetical protein
LFFKNHANKNVQVIKPLHRDELAGNIQTSALLKSVHIFGNAAFFANDWKCKIGAAFLS